MADSTDGKNKNPMDVFADDLDAMLNMGDVPDKQQVGDIEDDDAIDRLLMRDGFQTLETEPQADEFSDLDALIADDFGEQQKTVSLIDEFDDIFADTPAKSGLQDDLVVDLVDEFSDSDDESALVKGMDETIPSELNTRQQVEDIDEFADDSAANISEQGVVDTLRVGDETLAVIEEFPEVFPAELVNTADFLMADFDISSDDHVVVAEPATPLIETFAAETAPAPALREPEQVAPVKVAPVMAEPLFEEAPAAAQIPAVEAPVAEPAVAAPASYAPIPETIYPPPVDHSEEIAALTEQLAATAAQIAALKKQHQVFKQEINEKSGKVELVTCLENLDSLQTEQKKTKRAVDAVVNKKPVAAYVANGLAATALLIGIGFGVQSFIVKSQMEQLVQIIGKLQEQVNAAPGNDAAEKEMMRKQLDDLSVADSVAASQIAELNKALQSNANAGSAKVGGDVGKQIADLNSQNMQIGATLEGLQNKISALEKTRVAAAPQPKPEKKKPPVVEENWAVNLIAYKQDWYAKRKAEEYAGKGVPAKVSKTESKGENWYRLSVDGFKSQYEAAGYAAKVKKILNLDSVWVTNAKNDHLKD